MFKRTVLGCMLVCAGQVFAQSSVQLYGRISADYRSTSFSDFNGLGVGGIGGARIGFRGEERLSHNTKVNFMIEGGFSPLDGSMKSIGDRQSWVEYTNTDIGSLRVGKMYAFTDSIVARYAGSVQNNYNLGSSFMSSNAKRAVYSSTVLDDQGKIKSLVGAGGNYENALSFVSRSFSGWNFGIMLVSNQSNAIQGVSADSKAQPYQLKADYVGDQYSLVVGFAKNGGEGRKSIFHLGGKYKIDRATVYAAYQNNRNVEKSNSASFGVEYPIDNNKLKISYNWTQQPGLTSANQLGATVAASGLDSGGLNGLVFAVEKTLSKRTTLYSGLSLVKAKNPIFHDNKRSANQFIFGLDHWF
ncbi:porin [Lampropedia puyangensis]|uniref:Porin n=1 Tax=Lampropedia puyangensis TaxID=1330072 RepID=A0A4S8EU79_9BURK|nr:porin [Lampropedia puyangensis]THT95961.1 porin [Lampropedia puyangensis]